MRKVLPVLLAVSIMSGFLAYNGMQKVEPISTQRIAQYAQWKAKFGKLYGSPVENQWRLKMFVLSTDFVESRNAEYEIYAKSTGQSLSGPMFEINEFSDLSEEEFRAKYNGLDISKSDEISESVDLPIFKKESTPTGLSQAASYEVRVRNQGSCGSCWAFSAIAYSEKHYFQIYRQQVDLSHQELVDCSTENNGCQGGLIHSALKYLKQNGASLSSDYPYLAAKGTCRSQEMRRLKFDSMFVPQTSGFDIQVAKRMTQEGGLVPGTTVSGYNDFRYLSSLDDVYDSRFSPDCSAAVSHAINMIWATDDYVVVLNSWGERWAVKGTKKMRPCTKASIMGNPGSLSHAYLG